MCLTSCEGTLDDIFGEWSRPTGNNGNTKTTVAVKSVTLDQTKLTKAVGDDAVTLTATVDPSDASDKTVTWKSSDANIAAVDANGKVTFVAAGTATITATATNGTEDAADDKTATCEVTVTEPYAANEYNEASLDGTKVVFTKQTAASVTAVANSVTSWSGWYTVSGNVTITGNVTLGADVHLILQDGAKLTITGQLNGYAGAVGHNLYIYGQGKGDGKLIVENNSGIAIKIGDSGAAGKVIEIHGGEITAKATDNYAPGIYSSGISVYGGKLTAESNATGIQFGRIGGGNNFDVYGGEVVATSNATSSSKAYYGITSVEGSATQILKVYGGKVKGTGNGIEESGNYGSGFGCYVWSGTSGIKFYFSDNGTTWGDEYSYGIANSVGRKTDPSYTKKRYAKAE